ncbi:SIS domain-containing protein [Maliponia aquimaris]|uniref:Glutamine--fructose-6-phosphate aminotransferase [isomerizing] n=1 Tax=Maliponia aquimaris TaxID=1673631 RepID=A0A238KYZ2_9RHOB|nr:SIS domain-containing protein [Maliponia aquimaris]SMX48054.1 Glutamine--fructose-6-phosphate aminotransferase [isomerizing] [Maliponia aquimaris]
MPPPTTQMRREVAEIPEAVERLLTNGGAAIATAAARAREIDPPYLLSVARGSSDHACTYLKYASELVLRRPMASVGPSVASVYGVTLEAAGAVCISVSQSGQSPDIVRMTQALGDSGAMTVAITNDPASRLAGIADTTLPIHAGPERSVAATKTFVTSLVAGLWLIAEMRQDAELIAAIRALPGQLEQATRCDWSAAAEAIDGTSLFTLGRGPSWAISNEAALKFKETCLIHAESYSSAEVLHGPVSIVGQGFPVIAFAARDAAEKGLAETADALAAKGARVFAVTDRVSAATALPHVRTDHWLTDPIAAIVSFYGMVEAVAVRRGIDPDTPRHLNKVTETV